MYIMCLHAEVKCTQVKGDTTEFQCISYAPQDSGLIIWPYVPQKQLMNLHPSEFHIGEFLHRRGLEKATLN